MIVGLEISASQLDEVQYIAYGKSSQRFQTGNVASIKAKDIEKNPVNNPMLALQGRVPGLFIEQQSGFTGAGIKVRIQGQNSIANGNSPLYVIDGIPYSNTTPSVSPLGPLGNSDEVRGGLSVGFAGSALSFINPADIESIDILKDADATAIYGSRAANGAVLITTKKGKEGKATFDVKVQQGWGKVTRKMDMLNTRQYLDMRYEAFRNDSINWTSPDVDAVDLKFWDTTRFTDWQKVLIGNTAKYSNINTSLSGGNANTNYLISGTYQRETTVFPGNFRDRRGSLHFNLANTLMNKKIKFELSGIYMVDNNEVPASDFTSTAIGLQPHAPSPFKPDGSLNWMTDELGQSTWLNPYSRLLLHYQNKTINLLGNAVISYQIVPGLEIRSSFGYNNLVSDEIYLIPLEATRPERRDPNSRQSTFNINNSRTWIVEPHVIFHRNINKGKLDWLLGSTIQEINNTSKGIAGIGYNSDLTLNDIQSAAFIQAGGSKYSQYKYNALFSRLNYIWRDKYIFNFTGRRDGSSRFGRQNQFENFGAIGAAWIFSEENIIKNNIITFGKLRGSYGTTGSDNIPDYQFLSLYSAYPSQIAYQGTTGSLPMGLPNPHLQWESTKKLQVGIELGFIQNRLLLNITYARNRSTNSAVAISITVHNRKSIYRK